MQQALCRWPVLISGLCCSPRRQSRAVQMRVIRLAVFASACAFTYTLFADQHQQLRPLEQATPCALSHTGCNHRWIVLGGPVHAHSRCLCCWCYLLIGHQRTFPSVAAGMTAPVLMYSKSFFASIFVTSISISCLCFLPRFTVLLPVAHQFARQLRRIAWFDAPFVVLLCCCDE